MAMMLLNENGTVEICHSKTPNLAEETRTADILVAAVGRPKFVTADMVKEVNVLGTTICNITQLGCTSGTAQSR